MIFNLFGKVRGLCCSPVTLFITYLLVFDSYLLLFRSHLFTNISILFTRKSFTYIIYLDENHSHLTLSVSNQLKQVFWNLGDNYFCRRGG